MAKGSVRLRSIVKHFESLPDPRHERNRRHLLVDVMTIAVCGVIVGCSGPTAIERWAKAKKEWLKHRFDDGFVFKKKFVRGAAMQELLGRTI